MEALNEIHRVSRKHVVLSIPDVTPVFISIKIKIPIIKPIKILAPFPFIRPTHHECGGGGHHFEIGRSNYPLKRIKKDEVEANFEKFGVRDEQVVFLQGLFKDTLPKAPIQKLAVMRLDGDMYESTMDALTNLYPKLTKGVVFV